MCVCVIGLQDQFSVNFLSSAFHYRQLYKYERLSTPLYIIQSCSFRVAFHICVWSVVFFFLQFCQNDERKPINWHYPKTKSKRYTSCITLETSISINGHGHHRNQTSRYQFIFGTNIFLISLIFFLPQFRTIHAQYSRLIGFDEVSAHCASENNKNDHN